MCFELSTYHQAGLASSRMMRLGTEQNNLIEESCRAQSCGPLPPPLSRQKNARETCVGKSRKDGNPSLLKLPCDGVLISFTPRLSQPAHLSNLCPFVADPFLHGHDDLILGSRPLALHYSGVQVVTPPLPALSKAACNRQREVDTQAT